MRHRDSSCSSSLLVDKGVQIGVINLMPKNEWFSELPEELAPGMIFINWHF